MCFSEQQQWASESFDVEQAIVPDTPSAKSDRSAVVLRSRSWADFDFDDEIELLARSSVDCKVDLKEEDLAGKTDSTSTCSGSESSEHSDVSKACAPHIEQDSACRWVPVAMVSSDGQMTPMAPPVYPQSDLGTFGFPPARDGRTA